jgi:signal transduction histidine kinase
MPLPRRISLRARLTLIYGGLFLAAGVVLLAVTYALFNQQLTTGNLRIISKVVPGQAPSSASPSGPSPEQPPQPATGDADLPTGGEMEKWMKNEQERLHHAAITSLVTQGGIALTVVGGTAAGFGWLVADRVLTPLHRVTDTARRIAAAPAADRGLHERIALRGPDDEVKDLADAFDTMVERLDRSFDGQRRFVANASHELRTPLTLSRALVEMAMHRKTASEDVIRLGENLLEINTRHERLINGLLLLATSENEIAERRPVDLADVVSHVITQTSAEAESAGITVHDEVGDAPVIGDALLLERLVHNLVENGVRHNDGDGGWVRVVCRIRDNGCAEIEVSNTGPVVPSYEIPSLFEPFRRLRTNTPHGPSRRGGVPAVNAKGVGLGLSIVRSIARAHHGDATARPREGGGLVVNVGLPTGPDV